MEEFTQQITGGKYNYDMVKGLNQNFKLSNQSTTKQTFNLTEGWINFSKCVIGMTLTVTSSANTIPIFFQHCAMWDQIIIKSGQQTLFESINLAEVNKMLQMFRAPVKSGTNYLFQRRNGTNIYNDGTDWLVPLSKVGDVVNKQNISQQSYNLQDGNTFKDYTTLGCQSTNGTNTVNYSVKLSDICAFSICELDQDLYFKDGLQIIFLFNSINKICFQAATDPTANETGISLGTLATRNQNINRFKTAEALNGGITVSDLTFYRAVPTNPILQDTYFYYPYIYQNIINNFTQVFQIGSGHKHICDLVSFFDAEPQITDQYNNCILEHDALTPNALPSIQIYCDGGIALQKCSANEIQLQMFLEANLPLDRAPQHYSVNTELQYNGVLGAKYYQDGNILTAPDCIDKQRSITVNSTYLSGGQSRTPKYILFSVFLKKLSYAEIEQPQKSLISREDGQQEEQVTVRKVKTQKLLVN